MLDLSIVLPTCNRATLLAPCIASILAHTHCQFELIVVDGASDDTTTQVLDEVRDLLKDRLKVIRESRREGFVKAANKGFQSAMGRHMVWLNDDTRILPGALDRAVNQLDRGSAHIGLLALFHAIDAAKNIAYESKQQCKTYRLMHVRGTLYANFGMGRREVFKQLGYFDERFFVNGADPDLSLKAWSSGLTVEPAYWLFIDHDEHADDRRAVDTSRATRDNALLFSKWELPPINPTHNEFDRLRPCTLFGRAKQSQVA